jgi:hypothetical protein
MVSFNPWRHIPPLCMATGQAIGGLMPFWTPAGAIRTFGLPERIATAQPAQLTFIMYSSRATTIGVAMWIFYLRGHLRAVDTFMALLLYGCAVDAYACWLEGEIGRAWFRGLLGLFVGGWGLLGLTAGGAL